MPLSANRLAIIGLIAILVILIAMIVATAVSASPETVNAAAEWTWIHGKIVDQDGKVVDNVVIVLEIDGMKIEKTDWDDDGLYSFDYVPVGKSFRLYAYVPGTSIISNEITGTTTSGGMYGENLVIGEGSRPPTPTPGVPTATPTATPVPTPVGPTPVPTTSPPSTLPNPSWWYTDGYAKPSPTTSVPEPVASPVATATPTATPTPTPTPTPVPVSRESTSFWPNVDLWLVLLVIVVVVAGGLWVYYRQK